MLSLNAMAVSAQTGGIDTIELRPAPGLDPAFDKGATSRDALVDKASHSLLAIYREYEAHLAQAGTEVQGAATFRSRDTLARVPDGYVVIDAVATDDAEALAAELVGIGLKDTAVFGRMVSGLLPILAIPELEHIESLHFAHPAYAVTNTGSVNSQGDAAMRSDEARALFGVNGAGVLIGTLSDSFSCLGGALAGVASGDLPSGILVLEEGLCPGGTDEGRAMMELIHDVAPGAAQAFHTTSRGAASFAQGIIDLANAGAKVINDDVTVLAQPMFQDGIITKAADQVKALGVAFFSSAGNQGRDSYESPFRPSGLFAGQAELHDFDPGGGIDVCQQITIPQGGSFTVTFQWDQPFFSVSGPPGSASDLDIRLTDGACQNDLALAEDFNVGKDAVEVLGFGNSGGATTFNLVILRFEGPSPGLMKMIAFGNGSFDEFRTNSGTCFGHHNASGGLGVGAAFYAATPRFGSNPPAIESSSSAGGVPILFDNAGNRLPAPLFRQQPAITAPDGTDTTFFFPGEDRDGNGFPNFTGTSAAAPHAAAVAALMKQLNGALPPDSLYAVLRATAIDMDDPLTVNLFDRGFDFKTGHGLINAVAALSALVPPPPPPPPPPPAFFCNGRPATLVGTDGRDIINGTPGNDVIQGRGGKDRIRGLGGNDIICGGNGRDRLFGNGGRDRLFGEAGRDTLNGGSGFDRCAGDTGIDSAVGCERRTSVP